MKLGKTLPEYERNTGPLTQAFHETAERVRMHKEGGMEPILPLQRDDEEQSDVADVDSPQQGKKVRRS